MCAGLNLKSLTKYLTDSARTGSRQPVECADNIFKSVKKKYVKLP